jgi:hypothetical protein
VEFEMATGPPGFAIDEPVESLGTESGVAPGLRIDAEADEAALPRIR